MLEGCASLGIRMEDAWNMTPREYAICVRAANNKRKVEQQNGLTLAYLTAYWHRVEKLPKLNDVLTEMQRESEEEKEKDGLRALLEQIKHRNAALGGKVY